MATGEAKVLAAIGENFLVCAICSERYKNAKMLTCLHSFCETCLCTWVEKTGRLECPVCRCTHAVPDGGVSGIQTNFFLNNLVEEFKRREAESTELKRCGGCQQGEATDRCLECALNLCKICTSAHKHIPFTRTHRVVPLHEYEETKVDDPTLAQSPLFCHKHPTYPLTFYCDTCDHPICLECTAIDHPRPDHKYRYLKDAAAEFTNEFTEKAEKLKDTQTRARQGKAAAEKVKESLEERYRKEESKINAHIKRTTDMMSKKIEEKGKELLRRLRDEYETRTENLEAQLKELESVDSVATNARELAENLMRYGNDAQLMSAKRGIRAQVQELMTSQVKSEPVESDYVEFTPRDDLPDLGSLGEIVTSEETLKIAEAPKWGRIGEEISVQLTRGEKTKSKRLEKVNATMKTPDNQTEELPVTENEDQTLSVSFTGKIEGEHELSVSVDRNEVEGSPVVIRVSPQKGFVRKFGDAGSGPGLLSNPRGVTVTKNGNVLVCDPNNCRIQSFSVFGQHRKTINMPKFPKTVCPRDVVESYDGNLLITDSGNKQVIVCDKNGKLIRCFGNNQLQYPEGIAISPVNGNVYVSDQTSHRVRIYSQDGNHIKDIGGSRGSGQGQFQFPRYLDIDADGNVLVCDGDNHRIQVLNPDGQFLRSFGSSDGQLNHPMCVTAGKDKHYYVSSHNNSRILKYDSQGKFVSRVDCDNDGLSYPIGICIFDEESPGQLIVADASNNCIKVFQL